jgi:hypothetical protein
MALYSLEQQTTTGAGAGMCVGADVAATVRTIARLLIKGAALSGAAAAALHPVQNGH